MKIHNWFLGIIVVLVVISQTGCSVVSAFSATETPTEPPQPTITSQPSMTPTATEVPFYLDADVWDNTLEVPILIYHQFVPDYMNTDATKMRLADFRAQLQILYDNGFSLIPLKSWLDGNFTVPEGKKPLVITLDDLWFGNQIYIQDDGTPSEYSGIGVLWQFSQEHPDFGFHAALFAINGDKYYPEKQVGDAFYAADNVDFFTKSWHIKLGNTIAWAMENGLEVYSHTFTHPWNWPQIDNAEIEKQLDQNDNWLREYLREAGREDLIPKLDNMIALPEGKWPESDSGKQTVLNYKNTEEKPLLAVVEAYNMDAAQLTPSVFNEKFDPFHIARITASSYMIQYIVNQKELVPTMGTCKVGPLDESQAANLDVVQAAIQTSVASGSCPTGVYNINGNVFIAQNGSVALYRTDPTDSAADAPIETPTLAP